MIEADELSPPVAASPRRLPAPSPAVARKLAWTLGVMSAFGPFAIDMYLPAFPTIARNLALRWEWCKSPWPSSSWDWRSARSCGEPSAITWDDACRCCAAACCSVAADGRTDRLL